MISRSFERPERTVKRANDTSNRYRMRHIGPQDASASCLVSRRDRILGTHRAASVFRRAGRTFAGRFEGQLQITDPAERELALKLLEFEHHFDIALQQLNPQVMCAYSYSLPLAFTRFYHQCTVLDASSAATTESRLELCQLFANRLRLVLSLLGIKTVDRM